MTEKNYRRTITVNASAEEAYLALTTGYEHWWTACDDQFNEIGDRIKFTFPARVSYWTFEALKLERNRAVELECVEAFHKITEKPNAPETEWLGSRALWRIEPRGEQIDIHFIHDGLTPDLDCYNVCEAGWNSFFVDSLKSYLDTGVGIPAQAD